MAVGCAYNLGMDNHHPDLIKKLNEWGHSLGFSQIGVADVDLQACEPGLLAWLEAGFHGDMTYMARHGLRRARPQALVPGTVRVITARMDYVPTDDDQWRDAAWATLSRADHAYVSVYARGRDYHKVMRKRLQTLAERLAEAVSPLGFRVFTDSAPVLEAALAVKSGQGWRGKHTLVLNRSSGSFFFLGEIYVDMALPLTPPVTSHCGECTACLDVCPTQAIVAPYRLDARRCISYLTIEHDGVIPEPMRHAIGNRIYGCDDCQLVCPWNKYAQKTTVDDFAPRDVWGEPDLLAIAAWDEPTFLSQTAGSAIRRIGFTRWQRNVAIAMGNALASGGLSMAQREAFKAALTTQIGHKDAIVSQHVEWAMAQKPTQ